jgi:hypothetical protein
MTNAGSPPTWYISTLQKGPVEKTKPISKPLAGNPKHEYRNPKPAESPEAFAQNKANLAGGQVDINASLHKTYTTPCPFQEPKNKADSKPIYDCSCLFGPGVYNLVSVKSTLQS